MKEQIQFTLVKKTTRQRFYKASKPLSRDAKGRDYRYTNIKGTGSLKLWANKEKTTTKDWTPPSHFAGVVVSDAYTHIERICFPMWETELVIDDNPYLFVADNICGYNTFMTHGGDSGSVYDDKVYLRMLSKANGFQYKGIEV